MTMTQKILKQDLPKELEDGNKAFETRRHRYAVKTLADISL